MAGAFTPYVTRALPTSQPNAKYSSKAHNVTRFTQAMTQSSKVPFSGSGSVGSRALETNTAVERLPIHQPIAGETIQRMLERRRTVFLEKESTRLNSSHANISYAV